MDARLRGHDGVVRHGTLAALDSRFRWNDDVIGAG